MLYTIDQGEVVGDRPEEKKGGCVLTLNFLYQITSAYAELERIVNCVTADIVLLCVE